MFELLLLAPAVAAEAPAKARSIITNPDWMRIPSAADMQKFYPGGATAKGLSGRATIACEVTVAGDLANCTVVQEEPAGESFGAAALALSTVFKMKPKTLDGSPVAGGSVRIPIRFISPPRVPELEEATRCYGAVSVLTDANPDIPNWDRTLFWAKAIADRTAMAKSGPTAFEAALAAASAKAKADPAASRAIAIQCRVGEPFLQQPRR